MDCPTKAWKMALIDTYKRHRDGAMGSEIIAGDDFQALMDSLDSLGISQNYIVGALGSGAAQAQMIIIPFLIGFAVAWDEATIAPACGCEHA